MEKNIEDMTREELEEVLRQSMLDRYRGEGERFRLQFEVAGVKCFTEPMSLERLVELYHGYPRTADYEAFADALDEAGAFDGVPSYLGDGPWPVVQYEYIAGKVWRNSGQEYPA